MEGIIKVLSANCQGLRDKKKRIDVLHYLENLNGSILCLQETHWTDKDIRCIKNLWPGECFINGQKTNSRGVAILISPNLEYSVIRSFANNDGNLFILDLSFKDLSLRIINAYAPNIDTPEFFTKLKGHVEMAETDYTILCGDLNLTLNPNLDCDNYKRINNPLARNESI